MNFLNTDWRDRRHIMNQGISCGPIHYTIANYSTNAKIEETSKMKPFEQEILTKIHSIPDPLRKNLADTVVNADKHKEDPSTPVEVKEFYYEPAFLSDNMENRSNTHRSDFYPSLTGITSFFSNFFGAISGAVFHRRPKSPVSQYYDCSECDSNVDQKMAADDWQASKNVDENKRATAQTSVVNDNMSHCRAAVAQCEDKLNAVRNLLKNKTVPATTNTKVRYRRPRKAFVEAGSAKTSCEEYTANNYVSLSNDEYVEYFAIPNNNSDQFCDIKAAKMKTELNNAENTDIVRVFPDVAEKIDTKNDVPETLNDPSSLITVNNEIDESKEIIISSCEDKIAKLKALLQDKRKKPTRANISNISIPEVSNSEAQLTNSETTSNTAIDIPNSTSRVSDTAPKEMVHQTNVTNQIETLPTSVVISKPPIQPFKVISIDKKQDKRFKNPHRHTEKRKKSRMRKNIQDDFNFAKEIGSEDLSSSIESSTMDPAKQIRCIPIKSPTESFDETKGRFHSTTPDSDDSFQIVFADSPKLTRMRRPSDCDSEDSFIVFEDSPDSCYTSNDIFGDAPSSDNSDHDLSDSDSDISDSGCATDVCKLSHGFSRTVSDLTDDSLYDDTKPIENTSIFEELSPLVHDEVDCAVSFRDNTDSEVPESSSEQVRSGLLLDEEKKRRKKDQPPKKVRFSEKPPKVHVMRVWAFAARQARAGHWERHALDRERFKRRIADVDMAVSWVLKPQHRSRIMFQRFMPWWNQQKRKEAAEKKKREEDARIKNKIEEVITEDIKKEVSVITEYEDVCRFYNENFETLKIYGEKNWKNKVDHRCSKNKRKNKCSNNIENNNNVTATVQT